MKKLKRPQQDELLLDVPADQYHASPGVSNSALTVYHLSPRQYHAEFIAHTVERSTTRAMDFGSFVHDAILLPDQVNDLYVIEPDWHLSPENVTKNGKTSRSKSTEFYQTSHREFQEANAHRFIAEVGDVDRMLEIHNALYDNELANGFLQHKGHNEVCIYWEDERTGLLRRSRLDRFSPPYIVDLKVTEDIFRWPRTAREKQYVRQAAFYSTAYCRIVDEWPRFVFVIVQSKPPYHVRCFEYDNDSVDDAGVDIRHDLNALALSMEDDDWADPAESEVIELSTQRRW